MTGEHSRPPSYLDKRTLAWELCIAESTVDDFVRRGILPKPLKLSPGCVRWSWAAVEAALASFENGEESVANDPYMEAARNAAERRAANRRAPPDNQPDR